MSDFYKHKAKKYKYKYLKLKQEIKGGSLFKNKEENEKIKNFLKFLKDFLDNNITRIFNKKLCYWKKRN